MRAGLEYRFDFSDGTFTGFGITKVIHQERTPFQQVDIVDSVGWGRVLLVNGDVQLAEADESYSNELRIHVPIYSLERRPRSALLIAGASGGGVRELAKHGCLEEIVLVDVDRRLIEICREKIADLYDPEGAFSDPRVRIVIGDGSEYLRQCHTEGKKFDVIVRGTTVDVMASGHVHSLSSSDFYMNVKRVLSDDGVFVASAGIPTLQRQYVREVVGELSRRFANAGLYAVNTPSFGQGTWTYAWASPRIAMDRIPFSMLQGRFSRNPVRTKVYNPDFHGASFRLDNWHRSLLPQVR